ncbi:hypothetical protein [uncultured Acinetobacter sp.]|uniref:hypothetical protein n=1 Tax=uncultured Acinetobacter sp. TaxID=165433 RepID=UPI0026192812|nr:hypothetical protein [uncultured Acinetobacter sp.]
MNMQWKKILLATMLGVALTGCGSSSNDTHVPPSENTIQQQMSALILTSSGNSIRNATIKIAGQSFTTDVAGKANFTVNIPQNDEYVVVQIEKAGFVSQSVRFKATELENINARLIAVKNVIEVPAIEKAQVIESSELNASITLPANAFVRPNGEVATGKVTVEFSPWDIQGDDLNAMPANGVAQNAQNEIVNLISAGMISVTFKNEQGETLQLAQGKTAELRMDLPVGSIDNQGMSIGTEIPMWYFDESKGLWVEDGVGYVVESNQSATGLAVQATVEHFSTWNWDFQYQGAATVFVECFAENVAAPCHVTANATLTDNSKITRTGYVPAEGIQIVNMPSAGRIDWLASHPNDDTLSEVSSVIPDRVRIDLVPAKTNNLVRCLKDNQAIDCVVTLNGRDYSIGKEGSIVRTSLDATQLQWQARAQYVEGETAVYSHTGWAVSNTTEEVTILLDQQTKLFDKTPFDLRCDLDNETDLTCNVQMYMGTYGNDGSDSEGLSVSKTYSLPINQSLMVYLPVRPSSNNQLNFWMEAWAYVNKGNLQRQGYLEYEGLTQNKIYFNFNDSSWCDGEYVDRDIEVPRLVDDQNNCWSIPQ